MTHGDKELLLKDLCGRLPYGVIVGTTDNDGTIPNFWSLDAYNCLTEDVTLTNCELNANRLTYFCDARPYLFPLSSMTEEQCGELTKLINTGQNDNNEFMRSLCRIEFYHINHLDYRGLIPMGLAIDATNKNIY